MNSGKRLSAWTAEVKLGPQPIMSILRNRRVTVSQLAVDAGIIYGRLNRLVHGAVAPALVETEALARVLQVAASDLFTDEARRAGGEEL